MRSRSMLFLMVCGALAACGGSTSPDSNPGGGGPPVPTSAVSISGLQFNPTSVSVAPGTIVSWTNRDNTAHNVTFSSASITSIGDFSSGTRSATMPQQAGTYAYHCTIHPDMNGTIIVQ